MNWFRRVGFWTAGLVWLAVGGGYVYATEGEENPDKAETVVIPLDQIWALDMPGTRDVRNLVKVDTKHVPPRPSSLDRIIRALLVRPYKQMPGYAVPGKPNRNLIWASKALWKRDDLGPIPTTEDVNLTFFAQVSSYQARLLSVRRDGFEINVEYRFEPQYTPKAQVSFALIPLGKLPAGEYHVKVRQASMEQKYLDAGFQPVSDEQASRLVSGPFSFGVWDLPAPDPGPNENAVEIPLDQIWAYGMPGTRPMQDGQRNGKYVSPEGPLLDEIRRALVRERGEGTSPIQWKDAKPGFAVLGTGMDALREAHAVIVKKQEPRKSFPEDAEITLVFFSNQFGPYVHLHRIERRGRVVEIRYRFVPHGDEVVTEHLALISLSKLPVGKAHVKIVQSLMEQKYVERGYKPIIHNRSSSVVCKSFSFSVIDERSVR